MFGPAQKFVTALVTGWIGWGFEVVASTPSAVSAAEWLGLAAATGVALGVYAVPNVPKTISAPSPDRSDTDE